jgi:hypothetical protein
LSQGQAWHDGRGEAAQAAHLNNVRLHCDGSEARHRQAAGLQGSEVVREQGQEATGSRGAGTVRGGGKRLAQGLASDSWQALGPSRARDIPFGNSQAT